MEGELEWCGPFPHILLGTGTLKEVTGSEGDAGGALEAHPHGLLGFTEKSSSELGMVKTASYCHVCLCLPAV